MTISLRTAALAALSVFALAGCDESRLVGTLTANTTIRIVSPGGNKQVLNRGSYRTAVRVADKGASVFITANGKELTFKIPNISGTTGETIRVSAATMRQEFGISGRVYENRIPFDRIVARSCVYGTERRLVCRDRRDGERHREDCDWETVTITGSQDVREEGYSSVKNIAMDLVNTASQKIGNFAGSVNLGETITNTDILSGCRPDYHRYP